MSLTQELRLDIKAKDEASGVLSSLGRKASDTFGNTGTGMAALGVGVNAAMIAGAAGVTALGAAVAESVQVAGNFQQELAGVKAVTRANDEEMKRLTATAKELGSSTAFSASEAAQGMTFLGMAGLDATQIVSAMPSVLDLAAAGTLDLGSAADIATNIMSGMSLEVGDLNTIMDGLATVASSSNTDVRGVGQAMSFVAGTANAAGLTFESTSAALGLLANAGIQATRGGTSLNAALRQMLNPSKEAQKVAEDLGLTFVDVEGNIRPLVEITEDLENANLTAKQSFVLFGDEGKRAIDALVNQGASQLREMEDAISNSAGAAKEMAQIKMDTFQGSIKELSSAVEGLAITVGTPFLGFLKNSALLTADMVREVDGLATAVLRVETNLAKYNQAGVATVEQQSAINDLFGVTTEKVSDTNKEIASTGTLLGDLDSIGLSFKTGWEGNIEAPVVNTKRQFEELYGTIDDFPIPDSIELGFDPVVVRPSRPDESLDDFVAGLEDMPDDVTIKPIDIPLDAPPVDEVALKIENTLDSAFTQATGTLIRTGSLKEAAQGMFFNVLDTGIGEVSKDIGQSLSNMITSAFSGVGSDSGSSFASSFMQSVMGSGGSGASGVAGLSGMGTIGLAALPGLIGMALFGTDQEKLTSANLDKPLDQMTNAEIEKALADLDKAESASSGVFDFSPLRTSLQGELDARTTPKDGTGLQPFAETNAQFGTGGGDGFDLVKSAVLSRAYDSKSISDSQLQGVREFLNESGNRSYISAKFAEYGNAQSAANDVISTLVQIGQSMPNSSLGGIPRFRIGGVMDGDGPAYLHSGEGVLSQRGMDTLAMLNSGSMEGFVGGGGNENHFHFHISALDGESMERLVEGRLGNMIVDRIKQSSAFGNEILFSDGVTTPPTV